MPSPLTAMYLLGIVIGVTAFLVSRGPDGNLFLFLASFAVIGALYVTLAWVTRHQPIWLHLGAHVLLFVGVAALGMAPKPHLNEMGGMLYLLLPGAILAIIALACVARLLARWI